MSSSGLDRLKNAIVFVGVLIGIAAGMVQIAQYYESRKRLTPGGVPSVAPRPNVMSVAHAPKRFTSRFLDGGDHGVYPEIEKPWYRLPLTLFPHVELAPRRDDLIAKRFQSVDGKALVYVVVDSQLLAKVEIFIDGKPRGELSTETFRVVELPPGSHSFALHCGAALRHATLNVEAGGVYVLLVSSRRSMWSGKLIVSEVFGENSYDTIRNTSLAR